MFLSFKKDYDLNLPLSTLYKILPKQYKPPQQETVLYEHCELYPTLLQHQIKITNQINYTTNETEKISFQQQLKQIKAQITHIEFHKHMSQIQREEFKKQRE